MGIPYDTFAGALLDKITEYDLMQLEFDNSESIVDGYMKRAISKFYRVCKYDLTKYDDELREIDVDIPEVELYEIVDIVSEGMLEQWMKPYVFRQENLELLLNTKDFTQNSPSELLNRVNSVYKDVRLNYTNMIREYSYEHGDLSVLHL